MKKEEIIKVSSKINDWKPKDDSEVIVTYDGKLFICYFEKIFGRSERTHIYDKFSFAKDSYINQLDKISGYVNYFINNEDYDKELPAIYLKIKRAIDKDKLYNENNMDAYISFIYEIMFTDTIIDKVWNMVNTNYIDDIEKSSKKYTKTDKKYLESLEFSNQHMKILLAISFSMKMMSPCVFHYIKLNGIKLPKDTDIIYRFYKDLFNIFGFDNDYALYDANTGEMLVERYNKEFIEGFIKEYNIPYVKNNFSRLYYIDKEMCKDSELDLSNFESDKFYLCRKKINMWNKLYVYVKAKVNECSANNGPIFEQREIFGTDLSTVIDIFNKKVLISENIVKYDFPKHWDTKQKKFKENIIGFNKTILKFQLNYFLKEIYAKNLSEITESTNSEELSGSDKMLINSSKIDEGTTTLVDINIKFTMDRIKRLIDIQVTDEEIRYYYKHHKPNDIQIMLVRSYFAKFFNSYDTLELLIRHDYMTLALLLKKKILIESGYCLDGGEMRYAALPYILTGNMKDKVNNRLIRNNRFNSKIEDHEVYQYLINVKYKYVETLKPGYIKQIISTIVNTRFTYVTYEYPDLLDEEIMYSDDIVCDELLNFIYNI